MLESVIAHVVLPPKLPARQEKGLPEIERNLASYVLEACCTLRDLGDDQINSWDSVRSLVQTAIDVNNGQVIERTRLLLALENLGTKRPLILHVAAQNAGLFIRRHYDRLGVPKRCSVLGSCLTTALI